MHRLFLRGSLLLRFPLLPITPRQLHIYTQIAIQIGLRAIEIEVTDRDAPMVAADARVNSLAHNAVHAGEGADVDDSGGALPGQADRLSHVEDHLAKCALDRKS